MHSIILFFIMFLDENQYYCYQEQQKIYIPNYNFHKYIKNDSSIIMSFSRVDNSFVLFENHFFRYIYYLSPKILVQFCSCPTIIYSNRCFVYIKYQSFPTLVRIVPKEVHQQFIIERIFEKNVNKWWKGLEYHFHFNGKLIWGKIWINPVE